MYRTLEKKWSNDNAVNTVELLKKLVVDQEKKLYESEEIIKEYKLQNAIYDPEGNVESISNKLGEITNSLYNINAEMNISIQRKKILILNSQKK